MTDIDIVRIKNELRTDSRLLAGFLDHRHRTILENADKYTSELKQLGPLPFQTEKGTALKQGGFAKATRYVLLNEDQCYFLLTLMRNNERVVAAKLALVKAFSEARAQIARRDLARLDGKEVRRMETDSIKALVEYASANGSKSPERYFSNITKMTNSLLGIESGQRDNLSASELKQVAVVESIVDLAIRDGLKAEMPYKDIYQLAKARAALVVPAIGREV
jgi:phage regulator Rha-like protein